MNNSESIIINPQQSATASVIWLHGLGADGHDFVDIIPQLKLPQDLQIRFIFPHAPVRAISINANMQMRAWYNIYSLDNLRAEDKTGITESQVAINRWLEQEIAAGIPSQRIVLAGFSQGGAMALYAGLRFSKQLAGILALSTYLPLNETIAADRHTTNHNTPIMIAHGRYDSMVPMRLGRQTYTLLKKLGHPIQWHEYEMQHEVCRDEIEDIRNWLITLLSKNEQGG